MSKISFLRLHKIYLSVISLMLISEISSAALLQINNHLSNLPNCPVDYLAKDLPASTNPNQTPNLPIEIVSDTADSSPSYARLNGNVQLNRGDEILNAPMFEFDRVKNIVYSPNNSLYRSPNFALKSDQAELQIDNNITKAQNLDYYLKPANAQGHAQSIEVNSETKISRYEKVTYSSCVRGDETWQLRANKLKVNENEGRARARDVTLRVKNIPIIYMPYFSFPIDDKRHTGFLVPYFDYSSDGGLAFKAPYYINIAPDHDATLVPGIYAKRGVFLGGEYRYLNKWQYLTVSAEILPNDRAYKAKEEQLKLNNPQEKLKGNDRWSVYFHQTWLNLGKFNADLLFKQVSDPDYVKDFDNSLNLLTASSLERYASFSYTEKNWQTLLRFEDVQVLDREVFTKDPYDRSPQWLFSGSWYTDGLNYGVNSEVVRFSTKIRSTDNVRPEIGNRFDIMPYISYRFDKPWGYITPKLAYRYTAYNVNYDTQTQASAKSLDKNYDRAMPIFSIDTGLFFERSTEFKSLFGGGAFTQTLEPRLYYLYVPYKEQSHIPLFDTNLISPSYYALFLPNRYTGADRQMDANQLTTGLTTRFLHDETGQERLRLSIAQIQYFKDRRVSLDNSAISQSLGHSAWIAEGEASLNNQFSVSGSIQYATRFSKKINGIESTCNITTSVNCKKADKISRATFDLRYKPSEDRILNLGYRYSDDPESGSTEKIRQIDLAGFYGINQNWAVIGRYNYSLEDKHTAEVLAGVEYRGCCERIKLVGRYRKDTNNSSLTSSSRNGNLGIYLQVEFTGLTRVGRNVDELWRNAVTGYSSSSDWRN